jgi:hypothetical protein
MSPRRTNSKKASKRPDIFATLPLQSRTGSTGRVWQSFVARPWGNCGGVWQEAELTAEIVYVAQRLHAIAERGDRLIAATAVALDLPLITRDPQIAAAAGVECLWA